MKKYKHIITIVPLIKIPPSRNAFFHYLYFEKIPFGTLVEIPFGKRKIKGIVINNKNDFLREGNIQLKKIKQIVEKNFLTKKQISLASFISEYYVCSLGIALKKFVPNIVGSRKKTNSKNSASQEKVILTSQQKLAISIITTSKKYSKFLLFGESSSGKTQVYFEIIKKMIKSRNSQALILLPELTGIAQEIERYGKEFGKEVVVLHSKITKGQFYKNWNRVKSGKAKIVIGTRQAVFAPFKNLKLIIIDEEHDISHKQWDMNPRYDSRTVSVELAKVFNCKLVFGSATPRIETYYQAKKRKIKLLTLDKISKNDTSERNIIVDLRKEHWDNWKKIKTVSPLSKELKNEVRYNLKHKRQIILFINKQGMSSFTICANCKEVLKCPDCERALTYRNKGNYECLHCKFEAGDFPVCPNCQEMIFKNIGLGTEKIEVEINKLFPSAKIARADSSSLKTTHAQEKLWQDFSQKKIDILVGTQMITKAWDLPNVGLVGIVDADSLFGFPDFYTDEIAFSLISQAVGRINRTNSIFSGTAIIQTYHPENKIIQWASEKKYTSFYQYEIKQRRALNYPPFMHIIKLVFQNYDKTLSIKETQAVYERISSIKQNSNLQIYPPQEPLNPKIRGRYRRQILIKTKNYPKIPKKLITIIKSLKSGWIIDIEPINTI